MIGCARARDAAVASAAAARLRQWRRSSKVQPLCKASELMAGLCNGQHATRACVSVPLPPPPGGGGGGGGGRGGGGPPQARSKRRPPTPTAFAALTRSTLPANGRE